MENKPIKRETKTAKKKLFIGLGIILGLLLILSCLSFFIDYIDGKKSIVNNEDGEVNYNFYPIDFEEDIFKNRDYLELYANGLVSFKKGNVTIGIDKETAKDHGSDTKFIVDMLNFIINGDNDKYNNCFSSTYYQTHTAKDEFTMQMLYDVKIELASSEKVQGENGSEYTRSIFSVEYKIYRNNGSFRRDIGAGSKKQYLTLTNQSGEWKIDSVTTIN